MFPFCNGDILIQITSSGDRISGSTWTFRRYAENGRVMLMEFPDNEEYSNGLYTFHPEYFKLATPLEQLL